MSAGDDLLGHDLLRDDLLRLEGVEKSHRLGQVVVPALRGVDLCIREGSLVGIAGPSGSGKTTLLHLAAGLDEPSAGRVLLKGRDLASLGRAERLALRRTGIGFVFQGFHLVPVLTALENVEYPLWIAGIGRAERRRRAAEALSSVGLAGRAGHAPDQLSGGERQRVAIARAVVVQPSAILADEPTANLDSGTARDVMELFVGIHRRGTTVVVASHDEEVLSRAGRVVHLRDGRIVQPAEGAA